MPLTYLALSGGGANGAYGAGVLNGWTAAGTRPEFTFVSGVSTGALMAPFAFLGPSYDARLREVYTSGVAESLLDSPDLLNVVFGSSLFGSRRLRELIARYVDEAMSAEVAAAHANGRRLFVVTTNLDAQRAVIWDMGRIASSESPQARSLFADVLAASASVPAVFPPMLIDAEAHGKRFEEMHVDGAVTAPVFTLPDAFLLGSAPPLRRPRLNIYVLINNKVDPDFQVVPNRAVEIGGRAASTSVKAQTRSVLFDTYAAARRNGFGFNLTFIDQDVPSSTSAGFDTAYMRGLFQYGFEKTRLGQLWVRKVPSDALVLARSKEGASGSRREVQLEQD
jgi:patatin-like phospholipase/acyl hydrolase